MTVEREILGVPVDIMVWNKGTTCWFQPCTEPAQNWFREKFTLDIKRGDRYGVQGQLADDVLTALSNAGFSWKEQES